MEPIDGFPPTISSYEHDGLKIRLECREHTVPELLEAFEYVLRGAGFGVEMGSLEMKDDN